jgi:hypothetical protein
MSIHRVGGAVTAVPQRTRREPVNAISASIKHRLLGCAGAATIVMALLLAGCGSTSSHSSQAPAQSAGTSTQTASQPAAPPQAASGIPQGNGGDQDVDNNGGPSDGDGNV